MAMTLANDAANFILLLLMPRRRGEGRDWLFLSHTKSAAGRERGRERGELVAQERGSEANEEAARMLRILHSFVQS